MLEESLELWGVDNLQLISLLPKSLTAACIQRDTTSNDPYGFNFIFALDLKKTTTKKCFWLCCALELRAELQQVMLSCCSHPQWVSQQLSEPKFSPCSKNNTWSCHPFLVLLTHSPSPLCHFISERLNNFLEMKMFQGKALKVFSHTQDLS